MSPLPQHTAFSLAPRPVPAAVAAVIRGGDILLVRRAHQPNAGKWALPGGKIKFGESIETAVLRELFEETLVVAEVRQVFNAVDIFDKNEDGALRQHFILIAVLCRWVSGEPQARDDALEARWFPVAGLASSNLVLSVGVAQVVQQAVVLAV
ncbi:NUDIX domain-containing protein [Candidimonas sp. SYP-B2681]|uniref:NUDIX hydrolase n=1 Tax=Candidimonas sp. SYP-B2681 TaxID=2497686 RepID=UPI000F87C59C|nr:NUDIX hydrolase [Candidimonas sp. SYP-B2681]RTZ45723.1 NUDIX domain-containing protein [Candidimonas sp. SYP-B2681]